MWATVYVEILQWIAPSSKESYQMYKDSRKLIRTGSCWRVQTVKDDGGGGNDYDDDSNNSFFIYVFIYLLTQQPKGQF